jgi:hypothetical protein
MLNCCNLLLDHAEEVQLTAARERQVFSCVRDCFGCLESSIVASIFFLHQARIALMEAEAAAPGREVAYIYKTSRDL